MRKSCAVIAAVFIILFVLMLLLGCALKKDKPVRICEPYIVSKGETLWSISELYAKGDKRAWIYDVQKLNGIEGSGITEGETIYVYSGK